MLLRVLPRSRGVLKQHSAFAQAFHRSAIWASKKVLQSFKLADIGEGITECEVIRWNVKPLSNVQAFDPLCEVQSDKASVEITSPFDGVVKQLLVQEGEVAKVGEGLCLIEVDEETAEELHATSPELVSTPEEPSSSTSISASKPNTPDNQLPTDRKPNLEQEELSKRRPHPMDPNQPPTAVKSGAKLDVLATPSVRHFARQNNVDLASMAPGSGRSGRIEKKDIEAHLSRSSMYGTSSIASGSQLQPQESDVTIELGRTRYGMWKAMVKSLEIPHFGYSTYLDITTLHNLLPILNAHIPVHYLPLSTPPPPLPVNPSALYPAPSPPQVPSSAQLSRITYLPILLKTISKAMIDWPLFRSSITSSSPSTGSSSSAVKPSLTIRPHADISIALSTPTGLYTPTLQRVDTHSIYSLASQLKHISHLGRLTPCGLTPAEMPKKGGTITISNVGAIGAGEFASPILVPGGGVAIVAIGRARWIKDEEKNGERRLRVGISWSADHRVVEGAELAAFVECWRSWVENPERLIAEGI